MIEKIIVDADICIKLGGSEKYKYLYDILPLLAKQCFIHYYAYSEIRMPHSAVMQINKLIKEGKVTVVDEKDLNKEDRQIYEAVFNKLSSVMINPKKPNKNRGEACSLAYAKTLEIPVFATDEMNLQPIVDKLLNTGIQNIECLRIVGIVQKARKD